MKIDKRSTLLDHRIKAVNILLEVNMEDYLNVAKDIIDDNEFQRKKVINSKISNLLKEDITIGCSVPPLVLAISADLVGNNFNYNDKFDDTIIEKAFEQRKLLILDGKQRTHVFLKLYNDLKSSIAKDESGNKESLESQLKGLLSNKLRIEVYVGINKLNILYRMLTLNSGQTTMSTRHLMEMLYIDYLGIKIENIRLVADKDEESIKFDNSTDYAFKDVLDGFTSYLEKDESPIDRSEILDNINSANNLKQEDEKVNLFEDFIKAYKVFIDKISQLSNGYVLNTDDLRGTEYEIKGNAFGKTPIEIFKKSQGLSGFGAAVAELKDIRDGFDLSKVIEIVNKISFSDNSNYNDSLFLLTKQLDVIKEKSKKIGNDQRFYFKWFFRTILDPDFNFPHKFDKAIANAYKKTREEKSNIPELK